MARPSGPNVPTRLSPQLLRAIDAHARRLSRERRVRVSRSEAIRNLIVRGLDSVSVLRTGTDG